MILSMVFSSIFCGSILGLIYNSLLFKSGEFLVLNHKKSNNFLLIASIFATSAFVRVMFFSTSFYFVLKSEYLDTIITIIVFIITLLLLFIKNKEVSLHE